MKSFAIAGHCDSESKINHVLWVIKALRDKWPNSYISYASHAVIDDRIQDICDLCLYDKNNPIGNVDFENLHTKEYKHFFWELPRPGFYVEKTIPYHHFAHHLSYYNLSLQLLTLEKIDTITYLTYDCDYEIVEHVLKHYNLLHEYDAIFYDFFTPGNSVNSDFFTLSRDAVQNSIVKMRDQAQFFSFSHKEEFTIEQIYYSLMVREKIKFKVLDMWHKNLGRVGVITQNDRELKDIKVSPLNPQHLDVQMCPFLDWVENKIKMVAFVFHHDPTEPYEITIEFLNEQGAVSDISFNNILKHKHWVLLDPPPNYPTVRVSRGNTPVFMFELNDLNNYGEMKRNL